ncbi:hypothetical protein [Heyndrickxia acidicola]|jgi:hypothetical protein|uniref:Uncharacterized protein n=1 Tax=Heyndrickxia acidicola TaxID=209389 RepID=A0ABU6MD99_9BACI|nr:hypothetical protein [Heyndrickxia acidicola]MED1202645.1 hypothetical protein [Heyndrickxia acidicola]
MNKKSVPEKITKRDVDALIYKMDKLLNEKRDTKFNSTRTA